MSTVARSSRANPPGLTSEERRVIFASSLGTVFEWYDFYLYGSLAAIIAAQFFSSVNATAAYIFALLAFAAGFAVRPFGALVFGRLGDLVGRKYTFLVTILIMGFSTFVVGLLPGYAQIGIAAPVILIGLRLLQGLALGGEYGGAATFVAEHAPHGRRGAYTSWIQTTATLGLVLSLVVIVATRQIVGTDAFNSWAWRIPFLLSLILLIFSVYIRLQLNESPIFQRMKAEGKGSKGPIVESFGNWPNLKIVLLALFGLTAGEAVVWYGGQFYALFFMQASLKIDPTIAYILIGVALLIATPFFVVFGAWSDKIGRKPIIMAGFIIAAVIYFPLFRGLTHFGNPALETAQQSAPVTVVADPNACSFQFNPVGNKAFTTSCDIIKGFLARASVSYANEAGPPGSVAKARIGDITIEGFEGAGLAGPELAAKTAALNKALGEAIGKHGYPAKADPNRINYPMMIVLLVILGVLVTMVYGPIAAYLVELFPTRIRYTSMSLPYHIGNGWFGGFLPPVAFAMVATNGNIYFGLWYVVVISVMSAVVGILFLRETRDVDLHAEFRTAPTAGARPAAAGAH
jgi:MFS family permease